jgi:hypothetical protein
MNKFVSVGYNFFLQIRYVFFKIVIMYTNFMHI